MTHQTHTLDTLPVELYRSILAPFETSLQFQQRPSIHGWILEDRQHLNAPAIPAIAQTSRRLRTIFLRQWLPEQDMITFYSLQHARTWLRTMDHFTSLLHQVTISYRIDLAAHPQPTDVDTRPHTPHAELFIHLAIDQDQHRSIHMKIIPDAQATLHAESKEAICLALACYLLDQSDCSLQSMVSFCQWLDNAVLHEFVPVEGTALGGVDFEVRQDIREVRMSEALGWYDGWEDEWMVDRETWTINIPGLDTAEWGRLLDGNLPPKQISLVTG